MHRGHIKLWRRIKDNELWKSEPFSRGQAWIDLLLLANFEDGHIRVRGNIIPVKRGQVGWSILSLADRWKWSRGKVERFMTELESTQQIIQQKKRVTSLITIVNYNDYQKRSTTEHATDNTTDSTTDGQQTGTKKNVKNNKNKSIASKPSLAEVKAYCQERQNQVDPDKWYNHYEAKGWMIGKSKMVNWKAAVHTWEQKTAPQQVPKAYA